MSGLNPAWFSLVMSTSIVGIAAYVQVIPYAPAFLMWANVLFYVLLWLVYLARLVAFPRAFFGGFRQRMSAMGTSLRSPAPGCWAPRSSRWANYRRTCKGTKDGSEAW